MGTGHISCHPRMSPSSCHPVHITNSCHPLLATNSIIPCHPLHVTLVLSSIPSLSLMSCHLYLVTCSIFHVTQSVSFIPLFHVTHFTSPTSCHPVPFHVTHLMAPVYVTHFLSHNALACHEWYDFSSRYIPCCHAFIRAVLCVFVTGSLLRCVSSRLCHHGRDRQAVRTFVCLKRV